MKGGYAKSDCNVLRRSLRKKEERRGIENFARRTIFSSGKWKTMPWKERGKEKTKKRLSDQAGIIKGNNEGGILNLSCELNSQVTQVQSRVAVLE